MTPLELAQQQLQSAEQFVEDSRQQLIRAEQYATKMRLKVNGLVSELRATTLPR